jgi:hypothetical protein
MLSSTLSPINQIIPPPIIKGEVIPVLNLAPRHEDVWGNGGIAPPFLTSALDGGEWSGGRSPEYHWIGGWVGSRAGLDAAEKREISCPCQ